MSSKKNTCKSRHQKKDIMKIIHKRLNSTYIRKNDLKKVLSKSRDKDKTINLANNNCENKISLIGNINTNRSYNKTKLVKKNKKVKFSIPINLKNNKAVNNNINNINNNISLRNSNTIINTNNNSNINLKKNIIHRHTKSSFIQGTNLLLLNKYTKDIGTPNINNNNFINNEINSINFIHSSKISLNNFINDNKRISANNISDNKRNKKVDYKLNKNKIKNIEIPSKEKKDVKINLIKSFREPINNKEDGLIQIKEELKASIKSNDNTGLSKKFIEAQNNWRKNYFAILIQTIFRGYYFRKKYNKKNLSIKSISLSKSVSKNNHKMNINNVIYIKKKAKDNNKICNSASHHKENPTEENIRYYKDNKVPHKIKEIVISMKTKKDNSNDNNIHHNNYKNNFLLFDLNNNLNYYEVKYAFDIWKEYSNKVGILKKLKIYKKYKMFFRNSSYEKQRNNKNYKI